MSLAADLRADFAELPTALGAHVLLSASAMALALAAGLPLALLAARVRWVRWPALAGASLIQTIPALALLALFYPLLLALSALTRGLFGWGFAALGFLPALLALTLYALLPILRTTVAGLEGVDPAVREAGLGVGMSELERLVQVEIPLAAPVAMAGVRTAAVWTIGAATLATPVGQTCLGDYIFSGLQTENWVSVLFGCAAAAVLAFAVDLILGLLEAGLRTRSRPRILIALLLLLAGGAGPLLPRLAGPATPAYRIGAKNFSEQYILADLLRDRIEAVGGRAAIRSDLGSVFAFRALAANEIDVYVDYSGTLWTTVLGRTDLPPRAELNATLARELRRRFGVVVAGGLGFENAYVLAMRADRARALGVASIPELAPHAPDLVLGTDLEFLARPEWARLRQAYGLSFRAYRRFQPTFLFRAASAGEADVISAFSSDGRIPLAGLKLLADPKGAVPPYDALVLVAPRRAHDPRLAAAVAPLLGRIGLGAMQAANLEVDRGADKIAPAAEARRLGERIGALAKNPAR